MHLSRRTKAILTLSLLSPVFGELLSGSSPPLEFLNPISFLFLWAFYGSGVLLVHEAWVRWGAGYMRLMLLGMAYGIWEEGLAIKSWFDPAWMDLGVLANYGRIWGINTTWAVWLTIFHSMMSITAPIIVFSAFFPKWEKKELLTKRGDTTTLLIFITAFLISYFLLNPYSPPALQYSLTWLLFLALVAFCRKKSMPTPFRISFARSHPFVYGFSISFLLFFNFAAFPHSPISPVIPISAGIFMAILFYSGLEHTEDSGRYAQIFGFLSFWAIPMALIYETKGFLCMSVVGAAIFVFLLRKYRSIRVENRRTESVP